MESGAGREVVCDGRKRVFRRGRLLNMERRGALGRAGVWMNFCGERSAGQDFGPGVVTSAGSPQFRALDMELYSCEWV